MIADFSARCLPRREGHFQYYAPVASIKSKYQLG